MAFLGHEPCEKCGSRDNKANYSNGWWCFGCGTYTSKDDNISLRERIENTRSNSKICENITTSAIIPIEAEKWLAQYGLTKEEKSQFSWATSRYSNSRGRWEDVNLLILIQTEDYWQGRNFSIGSKCSQAKYLSSGIKPLKFYGVASDTLVFTEDVISAIKVGRFCQTVPLLGATLDNTWVHEVREKYSKYKLWLDLDKAKESVLQSRKYSQFLGNCSSIITKEDPKELTNQQILKELER